MSKIISKVGAFKKSDQGRVYSQSREIAAVFGVGQQVAVTVSADRIVLEPATYMDTRIITVSRRKERGSDAYRAVLDISPAHMPQGWSIGQRVQILVDSDSQRVVIELAPIERAIAERKRRLKKNLAKGAITMASLFMGGGIFAHATHQAALDAGLAPTLTYAVERDERYADCARRNNKAVSGDTRMLVAGIQDVTPTDYSAVDILEIGLPCTALSASGRAKKGLKSHTDDLEAGHLYLYATMAIALSNPAVVSLECVPELFTSDAWTSMRTFLVERGYDVSEQVVAGSEVGALEDRRRAFVVATCRSLDMVNPFAALPNYALAPMTFGDIASPIADDDAMWSDMTYLKTKQERDILAGKGFRMRYADAATTRLPTVVRNYAKRQSDGVFVQHSDGSGRQRLLTVDEHAAAKLIPVELVAGEAYSVATEILGQSGIYRIVYGLAHQVMTQAIRHLDKPAEPAVIKPTIARQPEWAF